MPSLRYLNSVLTVIAVLLTLNLVALWHTTPGGAMLDHAQPAQAQGGMTNAADQRKQIVDLLKQINTSLSDVKSTLKSGVTVKAEPKGD